MAPRIFISFAAEDIRYRDLLVGQAKNSDTPFELRDMSVQEPFDSKWKTRCREQIKEIKCAHEEGLPILGVHVHCDDKGAVPPELSGRRVVTWRWDNIANFIRRVDDKRSFWSKLLD
jgi:hypothetical protein